jgi:hypothetical protein
MDRKINAGLLVLEHSKFKKIENKLKKNNRLSISEIEVCCEKNKTTPKQIKKIFGIKTKGRLPIFFFKKNIKCRVFFEPIEINYYGFVVGYDDGYVNMGQHANSTPCCSICNNLKKHQTFFYIKRKFEDNRIVAIGRNCLERLSKAEYKRVNALFSQIKDILTQDKQIHSLCLFTNKESDLYIPKTLVDGFIVELIKQEKTTTTKVKPKALLRLFGLWLINPNNNIDHLLPKKANCEHLVNTSELKSHLIDRFLRACNTSD